MTGTVIVAKGKSLDVRTIDFEHIVDRLRARAHNSEVARKLIQSVDEFGMDMICADELNAMEFLIFYRLFREIRDELGSGHGLAEFLNRVCQIAQTDERFNDRNDL